MEASGTGTGCNAAGACAVGQGEQAGRGHQVVETGYPDDAVLITEGLEGLVAADNSAAVAKGETDTGLAASDLDGDHGNIAGLGLFQGGPELFRLTYGLQEQGGDPGRWQVQRVVKIVGDGGGDFLARGDCHINPKPLAQIKQRGECRAGMGDVGNRPRPGAAADVERADREVKIEVIEPHTVAAAADETRVGA